MTFSCPPLTFAEPDEEVFRWPEDRCKQCAAIGNVYCAAMNGANEEAVAAFLCDEIGICAIPDLIEAALDKTETVYQPQLSDILKQTGSRARSCAKSSTDQI